MARKHNQENRMEDEGAVIQARNTDNGVTIELIRKGAAGELPPVPEAASVPIIAAPNAGFQARREAEMAAGRAAVAAHAAAEKDRQALVRSDKELKAEGTSIPVFRPSIAAVDRHASGLGPQLKGAGGLGG